LKPRLIILFAAPCIFLAGCWSVKGVRESPDIRQTFTSSKSAELLAACISDAWIQVGAKTKTNRTTNGWTVIDESEQSTFGVADLLEEGGRTSVTYSGPAAAYAERNNLPGVRSCL
jgi:hypothetical protein